MHYRDIEPSSIEIDDITEPIWSCSADAPCNAVNCPFSHYKDDLNISCTNADMFEAYV